MNNDEKFFNYISNKNNAKISFYTSQSNICYCSNILSDNIKVSNINLIINRVFGYLSKVSLNQ